MPKGVDVSTWQHPDGQPIDWEEVRADGYSFALVKVTQGDSYTNPYFRQDLAGARSAGLLVGAYHFFDPDSEPTSQFKRFFEELVGEVLPLHAWLDFEPPELPQFTVTLAWDAFRNQAKEYNRAVGLYCDTYWHGKFVEWSQVIPRLWLADPSAETAPQGCLIWQREPEVVNGIGDDTDVDELLSYRGVNLPPPVAKDASQSYAVIPNATVVQSGETPAEEKDENVAEETSREVSEPTPTPDPAPDAPPAPPESP